MVRISKSPDIRRRELARAAFDLFVETGYENTSVSDIVKRVGVAQGTFYYHFQSKLEVLEESLSDAISDLVRRAREIAASDLAGLPKLNAFFALVTELVLASEGFSPEIHKDSNIMLHERITRSLNRSLIPVLAGIVRAGAESGEFEIEYPNQVAEFVFLGVTRMFHDPARLDDEEEARYAIAAAERSVERVLGIEKGDFHLRKGNRPTEAGR